LLISFDTTTAGGFFKVFRHLSTPFLIISINTTATFFCHSREDGNPECLWALETQLDIRFRGYDGGAVVIFY